MLIATAPAFVAACSALVDLNGLAGGAADASAGDASSDGAGQADGAVDAAVGPGGEGGAVDGGSSSDASAADAAIFADDFGRADGMTIGNGWVQKYLPAFQLSAGRVERLFPDMNHDFPDNIVYRPVSESMLDVSVAVDMYLAMAPGYPQIHARIQPSTVTTAGMLDSYILFVNGTTTTAIIARQHGGSSGYTTVGTVNISPALATGTRYRMILTVTGTSPVTLTGAIQDLSGAIPMSVGTATVADSASNRITTPGTVGFAGGRPEVDGNYFYDNFTREPR
jgi:hypothetical protein